MGPAYTGISYGFYLQVFSFTSAMLILTCTLGNTNRQNFELFAAVADVRGVGVPLSYLLICTTKAAAKGSKEEVISRWLDSLKKNGIHPEFVLTDKDQSEINAIKRIWPNAKHQLCFWHALHAVKQ